VPRGPYADFGEFAADFATLLTEAETADPAFHAIIDLRLSVPVNRPVYTRVARFLTLQHTKTGKIPNY
jgi:hypothetical protein